VFDHIFLPKHHCLLTFMSVCHCINRLFICNYDVQMIAESFPFLMWLPAVLWRKLLLLCAERQQCLTVQVIKFVSHCWRCIHSSI